MTLTRKALAGTAGALLALAALPLVSTAANAHDQLVSADPVDGASVDALEEIALQFNNAPLGLENSNLVRVIGPDGRYYETGCPTLAGPVVSAPVELGAPGEYEVQWRVVSSDGHPIAENSSFTYAPGGDVAEGAGSETPLCGGAVAASPGVEPGPDGAGAGDAAEESRSDETRSPVSGLWIGVGVGGFAVIAVAAAAFIILRRPRSEP
ncbi:copper resistance CopC family protein [Leucobacter manosquensis]|uniref:Copper resistance protein CopC n=1 Tax=Leucobacter manosquensis TaxID=2810611 RepID=A0ABS5M0N4_9MICO|nr:copper resistance protein CopC [Leucobacter manosquensis]